MLPRRITSEYMLPGIGNVILIFGLVASQSLPCLSLKIQLKFFFKKGSLTFHRIESLYCPSRNLKKEEYLSTQNKQVFEVIN